MIFFCFDLFVCKSTVRICKTCNIHVKILLQSKKTTEKEGHFVT